jgi:predicted metal-dependent HD superfamily phosphohydrolase
LGLKTPDLRDRWLKFWKELNPKGKPLHFYDVLEKSYSEPHRYYHNLQHISHCLNEYDEARHLLEHPLEVEMAIWFHDVIYEIGVGNNEERSAELAYKVSREIALPRTFGLAVHNLILTTLHTTRPKSSDALFMADIDLSSIGLPQEEYARVEDKIRKEYATIPEEQFKKGRADILRRFLDRPSIYYTAFFSEKYEAQARRNIERALAKLAR